MCNPLLAPGDTGPRRGKRTSVSNPLLFGSGPSSGGGGNGGDSSEDATKGETTPKRAPRASVVTLGPKATENPLSALKIGRAHTPGKGQGAGRASVIQPNALGGAVTLTDMEGHEFICSAPTPPPAKEKKEPAIGGFFLTAADAVLGLDDPPAAVQAPTAEPQAENMASKRLMNTFSQMSSVMDRLAKLKARRAEKKKDASPEAVESP